MVRFCSPGPSHKSVHAYYNVVCQMDESCVGFPLRGQPHDKVGNLTCYKGGETVFNHQMCD